MKDTAVNIIDTFRADRIALARLVKALEPLGGKYWNRQRGLAQDAIKSAAALCSGGCQFLDYPSGGSAPVITSRFAADRLKSVEEDIHTFDTLSTDPRIEKWSALIEELAALSRSFADDGMRGAPFDAKRLGLVRGTVNW